MVEIGNIPKFPLDFAYFLLLFTRDDFPSISIYFRIQQKTSTLRQPLNEEIESAENAT